MSKKFYNILLHTCLQCIYHLTETVLYSTLVSHSVLYELNPPISELPISLPPSSLFFTPSLLWSLCIAFELVAAMSFSYCYLCSYSLMRNNNMTIIPYAHITSSYWWILFIACWPELGITEIQVGAFNCSLGASLTDWINSFLSLKPFWSPDRM